MLCMYMRVRGYANDGFGLGYIMLKWRSLQVSIRAQSYFSVIFSINTSTLLEYVLNIPYFKRLTNSSDQCL